MADEVSDSLIGDRYPGSELTNLRLGPLGERFRVRFIRRPTTWDSWLPRLGGNGQGLKLLYLRLASEIHNSA